MIFGPSIRELFEQHGEDLTSYARRFVAESDEITKDDFVAGPRTGRPRSTRRSANLLDEYDALICPTFAVPALPAEYDVG